MNELVYENITKLQTPVGFFCVSDENGLIPFSVERYTLQRPYEVTDDDENVIGHIIIDTPYLISLDVDTLQTGKEYIVKFMPNGECQWEYCDSDEDSTSYSTRIGEWVIGIGGYDINTWSKYKQRLQYSIEQGYVKNDSGFLVDPPEYDETKLVGYIADALDSLDGYQFRVIDSHFKIIRFSVAWVKVDQYPVIEYENALGSWLC